MDFVVVRNHAEKAGYKVIPEVYQTEKPLVIDFEGVQYRFFWNGDDIVNILADNEEIHWKDVPSYVKGLL
jgi:hypothetical protein